MRHSLLELSTKADVNQQTLREIRSDQLEMRRSLDAMKRSSKRMIAAYDRMIEQSLEHEAQYQRMADELVSIGHTFQLALILNLGLLNCRPASPRSRSNEPHHDGRRGAPYQPHSDRPERRQRKNYSALWDQTEPSHGRLKRCRKDYSALWDQTEAPQRRVKRFRKDYSALWDEETPRETVWVECEDDAVDSDL